MIVHDGGELIGFAPWFVGQRADRRYRLVGARTFFRLEPLAVAGREHEVATSLAETLAAAQPRPARVSFEGIDATSRWPDLLAAAWPGGATVLRDGAATQSAPTMALDDSGFEDWLAGRSRNFRRRHRTRCRDAEAAGAAIRIAQTPAALAAGLDSLARLHYARWTPRGGSGALDPATERMIRAAGEELLADDRIRLYELAIGDRAIAAYLCTSVGGEVTSYLVGLDTAWERLSPGLLTIVAAVQDAFIRGERRIDFGPGAEPYKWRLADRDEQLAWITLLPAGPGRRRARLRLAAEHTGSRARSAARHLPLPMRRSLRRLRGGAPVRASPEETERQAEVRGVGDALDGQQDQ
jgi:CelD/BcsL family acetyltransferase involved in cellulose biosynthesis